MQSWIVALCQLYSWEDAKKTPRTNIFPRCLIWSFGQCFLGLIFVYHKKSVRIWKCGLGINYPKRTPTYTVPSIPKASNEKTPSSNYCLRVWESFRGMFQRGNVRKWFESDKIRYFLPTNLWTSKERAIKTVESCWLTAFCWWPEDTWAEEFGVPQRCITDIEIW